MDTLVAPALGTGEIQRRAWQIGTDVAAPAAPDVDEQARFPKESVEAMREARLLAALVPRELGGLGASVSEVAGAVRALAVHCASSALVLAMHSIEVASLARNGTTGPLQDLLGEVGERQLLLANANSEVGLGGDVGRSFCALVPKDGGYFLDKQTLAISYGEYADAIIANCRRSPDAAETDQVLVVCRPPTLRLEPTSTWDTMGLRGTCSKSFHLTADIDPKMIFPVPFSTIANHGAGQLRQLLLSAAWVGLAEAAAAHAHAYVRKAARKEMDKVLPNAVRFSELVLRLQESRSLLDSCASWYEAVKDDDEAIEDAALAVALRNLKVGASRLAVECATSALTICGIEGFRRDGKFPLDRVIRDAHGGLVMVSNDRQIQDNAAVLRAWKDI